MSNLEEPVVDKKLVAALDDFRLSYTFQNDNIRETKQDYEFYLGKQWSDQQLAESKDNNQGHLTQVNNIRPFIHLVEGFQRQNRSDIVAFPEGDEDSIDAEIATRLMKNTMKLAKGEYKQSDQFKHGIIGGASYLQPFMDYSKDIIFGELKLKVLTGLRVYYDPSSEEYDMSDARYQCMFKPKMSKEDIKTLFPEFNFDKVTDSRIRVSHGGDSEVEPFTRYYFKNNQPTNDRGDQEPLDVYVYDMLEYYYKKHRTKYFIINLENNGIIETFDKDEAEELQAESEDKAIRTRLVTQRVASYWRRVIVGDAIVEDKEAEFSEHWKGSPLIPFRAYFCPVDIKEKGELSVQGIVRPMKEPQREKNVARTHARRHLLSSTSSGWLAEKDAFVNKNAVRRHASKNGAIIEFKKGAQRPEQILPQPLSSGFEFLSTQSTEDLKATSGINDDLLAMQNGSESGRAIMLRMKQGIVMIQSLIDNQSQTTEILGRFLVSVLPIIYTTERAMRVLGESFLMANFGEDIKQEDPATGQEIVVDRQVNVQAASETVTRVLTDKNLANYTISVGEGINAETVKFVNLLTLNEMRDSGIPIPPDVLIDETSLSSATKEKIKNSFRQQQQAQGGK